MNYSPLSQFKIYSYTNLESITNFSLTTIFYIIGLALLMNGGLTLTSSTHNTKTPLYLAIETKSIKKKVVDFIYNLTVSGLSNSGKEYFGVILVIFISVLGFNVLGLIPYSFTLTSHLVIALSFSFPVFIAMTFEAIYRHKGLFFGLFLPAGAPIALIPLLTLIELISYIARLFSLAIRLGANLIAGHVILKIIATAASSLFYSSLLSIGISVLPIGVLFIFYFLEFAVALLQAYVFAVLTCNYLNDALAINSH